MLLRRTVVDSLRIGRMFLHRFTEKDEDEQRRREGCGGAFGCGRDGLDGVDFDAGNGAYADMEGESTDWVMRSECSMLR